MNINSPKEMYQFLISNGISGISSETTNLISCMDSLLRMCPCDDAKIKNAKYNMCIQHYISITLRINSISAILLSKANDNRIIFFLNGQKIGSVSR